MPRLALLQLQSTPDPVTNLSNTMRAIEKAADGGAQIVCTQELFNTNYFPQKQSSESFQHAQLIPGELTEKLSQLSAELSIVIVASTFEKRSEGLYHSTTFAIDTDGSYLGKYRKMHIPQDVTFQEKYYFTQGEDGYQVFQTKLGKLGILLGWDSWFPEAARILALMGAEIIICPTSIGITCGADQDIYDQQHDAWRTMLRSHSITNACYLATINRCGIENDIEFWGRSFITNEFGHIIAEGKEEQESIVYADINLDAIAKHRANWPFFRDRHITSYTDISKRDIQPS